MKTRFEGKRKPSSYRRGQQRKEEERNAIKDDAITDADLSDFNLNDYLEEVMAKEDKVERTKANRTAMKASDVGKKHIKRGKAIEQGMYDILSKVGKYENENVLPFSS